MRIALLLALLLLPGCYGGNARQQIAELEQKLAEANARANKAPKEVIVEKIKEVVVTEHVKEVVKDTTSLLNWFKVIGMGLMGLSIGFYVIARSLFGGVAVIGLGGFATGATFFGMSLSTQIALGWAPYFLFAWLVIGSLMALVWILKNVNWTPDEKEAVDDIRNGRDTELARKLLADLNLKSKNQGESVVAPTKPEVLS